MGRCSEQADVPSTNRPILCHGGSCQDKEPTLKGILGCEEIDMMMDLGSSVSLIKKGLLSCTHGVTKVRPVPRLRIVTASGNELSVQDKVLAAV